MPGAGGPTKAVIIDSWPMVRIGLARVLQLADVRSVGETDRAAEGLAMIRGQGAELAVVGHHSGSAAATVRHIKALDDPPVVVVLVGRADRAELASLLGAGADGLLVQSVGPEELTAAVARLLAGERVMSPGLLPSLVGMVAMSDVQSDPTDGALTPKEREVLAGLAAGRSNGEIAASLFLSGATVKTHLNHIYAKLGVRTRHEAVARAVALGLLR